MPNNKNILITGGTGSFGKAFATTVLRDHNASKVIIFSRDELKQYEMQQSEAFSQYIAQNRMRFFIGDVRDRERLNMAMSDVDIVIHAAALKQVPAAEYNPFEAVKTNIIGSQNVIDACLQNNVEKVVALSTDKAAAPINLYGATKLTADKLFVAANNYTGKHPTHFSVVRYGNVMGSRGSVIPFFQDKKHTGVLPITDPEMTRFNITLKEGVEMVISAIQKMWGGELYVPKIPSYRITDVAIAVAPECTHEIVGIRPGEKLHEEMITATDAANTIEFDDYFVILPSTPLWDHEKFINESNSSPGRWRQAGRSYDSGSNDHFLSSAELVGLIENEMYEI